MDAVAKGKRHRYVAPYFPGICNLFEEQFQKRKDSINMKASSILCVAVLIAACLAMPTSSSGTSLWTFPQRWIGILVGVERELL